MHKCLAIPELVTLIAESLPELTFGENSDEELDASSANAPKPLASFALTCRAFYEPAMNIAWHTLHTLRPVVKCFPENIWEQDDDGQVVCQIILTIPF